MNKVLIIAEAGVNHNGDMAIAMQLVDAAAKAGADYVKFQTFKAEDLVSRSAKKADYQVANTGNDDSQFAMLKKLELSEEDHLILIEHCKKNKVKFLSSAFDPSSLDILNAMGMELFKIPSGEITNYPYLVKVASYRKPVILSTGMSTMEEISAALDVLLKNGLSKKDIIILHCTTEYPAPMQDVNLLAMQTIQKEFQVEVGYSDHTIGIEIPIAAVALGATVIEKHFTLDKKMEGPDHKASLEPKELKAMVAAIRNIEVALGDGVKKLTEVEKKNSLVVRKSVHYAKDLDAGHVIGNTDVSLKRPGSGFPASKLSDIVGKKLSKAVKTDEMVSPEDLIE